MQVEESAKATSVLTIILQVYKLASNYVVSEYDDKHHITIVILL
jgi:hypothetical protein